MDVKTFSASTLSAVEQQLNTVVADGFQPTLAIVFASIQHDLAALGNLFKTRKINVFGASSSGEILDAGGSERVYEQAIVVMLMNLRRDAFKIRRFEGTGKTSFQRGQAIGKWAATTFNRPAMLLSTSGMATDGEQVVRGLLEFTGDIPIFGGMAGDDLRFTETYVFDERGTTTQGSVALLLDRNKVNVYGVSSSGWEAMGGEKTVTRSEGNVVYSIDDQPVTAVYQEYLGVSDNLAGQKVAEYPLQIQRDGGYSVMRAALVVNPENETMIYAGSVPEGAKVRFCVSPGLGIIEHALTDFEYYKNQLPHSQADAVILFSCKGRHLGLGPMAEDEVHPIQQLWNAPLIGFYAYGEFGKTLDGKTDFHNETCVLVAIDEK